MDRSEQRITADELLRLTRPITMATVKAVAAGNSGRQEDIIAAANMGRKAVSDLLRGCRVNVYLDPSRTGMNATRVSSDRCLSLRCCMALTDNLGV